MRYRPLVTIAAAAAVLAALPAHAGGMKTLDGKKTKALTFSLKSSPQSNDTDLATDQVPTSTPVSRPSNMATCPKTRCLFYSFKFAPAKGVKYGAFSAKISWTIPGQDYDLYVAENGAVVAQCGASVGTSEVVVVPSPAKRKVYTIVVDQYRALPDTVTGSVTFPAKDAVGSTVPEPPVIPTNCGLS